MDEETVAWLEEHRLLACKDVLEEMGVEIVQDLLHVRQEDLEALGLKPVQVRKFVLAVESGVKGKNHKGRKWLGRLKTKFKSSSSNVPGQQQQQEINYSSAADGDNSSKHSSQDSSSRKDRRTGSKRMSPLTRPGGYNDGGYRDYREDKLDEGLALDVRLNRVPAFDTAEMETAAASMMRLLNIVKKSNLSMVQFSPIQPGTGRPGANPGNEETSSYAIGYIPDDDGVRLPVLKSSTVVRASVEQVMGLLLAHDTNTFSRQMDLLDGSFVNGQVFRVLSPDYDYPRVPLCTIKRSCHRVNEKLVDFVYKDYYTLSPDGSGVITMQSLELPELENIVSPNKGSRNTRGYIMDISGIVLSPLENGCMRLTYVLAAQLPPDPAKRFSFAMPSHEKSSALFLEAMVSVVDSVRVYVDSTLKRFGSLENSGECPPKAKATTSDSPTISSKALKRLAADASSISPVSSPRASGARAFIGSRDDDEERDRDAAACEAGDSMEAVFYTAAGGREAPERSSAPPVPLLSVDSSVDSVEGEGGVSRSSTPCSSDSSLRLPEGEDEAKLQLQRELEEMRRILKEKEESEKKLRQELEHRRLKSMKLKESPNLLASIAEQAQLEAVKPENNMESEIERLRRLLSKYREFLPKDVNEEDLDVTLDDAEAKMKEAVQVLMTSEDPQEQMKAQSDFDKWDSIVQNHPDYKERERLKDLQWEEDNEPKNQAALETMRGVVKKEFFMMPKSDLLQQPGVTAPLAKRIQSKKVFQLYYKTAKEINKLHPVALTGTFTAQGLDIVEQRALYAVLPKEFTNDSDGKKAQWKANIKAKLQELVKKEEAGSLRGEEKRSRAYKKDAGGEKKAHGRQAGACKTPSLQGSKLPQANPLAAMLAAKFKQQSAGEERPVNPVAAALKGRKPAGQDSEPRPAVNPLAAMIQSRQKSSGGASLDKSPVNPLVAATKQPNQKEAIETRGSLKTSKESGCGSLKSSANETVSSAQQKNVSPRKPHERTPSSTPAIPEDDIMAALEKSFGKAPAESTKKPVKAPAAPGRRLAKVPEMKAAKVETKSFEGDDDLDAFLSKQFHASKAPPKPSIAAASASNVLKDKNVAVAQDKPVFSKKLAGPRPSGDSNAQDNSASSRRKTTTKSLNLETDLGSFLEQSFGSTRTGSSASRSPLSTTRAEDDDLSKMLEASFNK